MAITQITSEFSVAPQITPDEVAALADQGFRAIMCNRPDDEEPGQPSAAVIKAAAERHDMTFVSVPVVSGQINPGDVAAFKAAMAGLSGPVLAYCRSGARCRNLWMLAQA